MTDIIRKDRLLVVDVEMACWAGPPPAGCRNEIIQIGVVEVGTVSLEITREKAWFIQQRQSHVSDFCTRLTGITPEIMKRRAVPLEHACNGIRNLFGTKAWACWGNDWRAIEEDCALKGARNPFTGPSFDMALQIAQSMGLKKSLGLGRALDLLGLEFEGRKHDALDDARNTARAWIEMNRRIRERVFQDPRKETDKGDLEP